ncbi:type VII secretion system-associated protein [Saccharopolyspora pogona]|uniref:type VII secretion system-associated protein n=1 Tax=Saccharopolyspora pogona TaxID=333966 RepID=UPI001683062A|nr:type VII secretion system-associated protein [Saccharopolyspora pogona]
MLMDPQRVPEAADEVPSIESVVNVWPSQRNGRGGRFLANPDYVPAENDSPSDVVDANLRFLMQKGPEAAKYIRAIFRDARFEVVMNGDGHPQVVRSPDGAAYVLVATAESHKRRVSSPVWWRVGVAELIELTGDENQVLFNPGSAASVRVAGDVVRGAGELAEQEIVALYEELLGEYEGRCVLAWDIEENDSWVSAVAAGDPVKSRVAWPDRPSFPRDCPVSGFSWVGWW